MNFFRSPCYIQTPSRLISCTGGWQCCRSVVTEKY